MPAPAPPARQSLEQMDSRHVVVGWLVISAGAMFLVTVSYLFVVLPATGWSIAMFDAPADLLRWIAQHGRVYQILWLLYFVSQMCLLAVPALLSSPQIPTAAVFGTASVVLAMTGLALLFAASPVLAQAYSRALAPGSTLSPPSVLVLHDVVADTGKVLRLFSELLLGVWLTSTGRLLQRQSHHRRWWALSVLGCWTFVVAAVKLFVPTLALEDWLAFMLGIGYLLLGVGLLRPTASGARRTRGALS